MIILDTNVVSELIRRAPDTRIVARIDALPVAETARERTGRPISTPDAQIAAICRTRGATLATRNVRDFDGTGVDVVDPWA